MVLTTPYRNLCHAGSIATVLTLAALAPSPARADFFDDVRRTFQTDIPHFFQDDIPCAFGGQPTSHTKTSCKSSGQSGKRPPATAADRGPVPPPKPNDARDGAFSPLR